MRVAFDYQVFCMQPYGGISRYFARTAEQLAALDTQVQVFSGFHRNFHLEELPAALINGRRVDAYPRKCTRLVHYYNRVTGKQAMKRWRSEVVHETYYSQHSSGPKGCPVVLTVYDMIHELYPQSFSTKDKTSEVKRIAVARADHVICISQSTKKDLIRLFSVPEHKVSVVHLGFEKFPDSASTRTSKTTLEKPFLLYVGSRTDYKNFAAMLQAIGSSKRLREDFEVVAFGGGAFSVDELALMASLGFKPGQIKQVGGGDEVLGRLYKTAKAFVYPSLYEGFGLPPLEAMAHSCPVVSSNSSSMPEVIGNAGEFFDPLCTEDMAAAIQRVVYDSGANARLQALGRERLDHFSWQRCAAETLSIYQTLR